MVCDWPCEAAHCKAADNLFDIIDRALSVFRIDVAQRAIACARHSNTFGGTLTLAQHLQRTDDALTAANNSQWLTCIEALEHIGTGGGSGYTQEQEWTPPDSLVEAMEKQLAAWRAQAAVDVNAIFIPGKGTFVLALSRSRRSNETPQARQGKKKKKKSKRKSR